MHQSMPILDPAAYDAIPINCANKMFKKLVFGEEGYLRDYLTLQFV
jgi:hypothetical protein